MTVDSQSRVTVKGNKDTYRVSYNTLVLSIPRLPGHLESFSWSPFNSDFKTVLISLPSIIF